MRDNPAAILPDIITTKTHSVLPDQYISADEKASSPGVQGTTILNIWLTQ